jgi:protein SCO1/2
MKNKKVAIFLTSFFLVLGVVFIWAVYPDIKKNQESRLRLPIIDEDRNHHVGTFSFTSQDGKTITNDDVRGKIYVAEYFFATCKGICPRMNENMEKVYQAFKGDKRVMILSHTVDPKKDTPQALKTYSLRFDADPEQWLFLTGDKKQLYNMARYSYLISAQDDTAGVSIDQDFIHDKHVSLVDGFGRVRGFYDALDPTQVSKLMGDITELLKEKNTQQ